MDFKTSLSDGSGHVTCAMTVSDHGNLVVKKCSPVPSLATTNLHSALLTLSQGSQAARTDLFWILELHMPPQYIWICSVFHLEILLPLQIVITVIPSERFPFAISFNVQCLYHKGPQSMVIFLAIIATGDYFLYDYSGNIFPTWKHTMKDKGGGLFFKNLSTQHTLRKLWNTNATCSQCSDPSLTSFVLHALLSINHSLKICQNYLLHKLSLILYCALEN